MWFQPEDLVHQDSAGEDATLERGNERIGCESPRLREA